MGVYSTCAVVAWLLVLLPVSQQVASHDRRGAFIGYHETSEPRAPPVRDVLADVLVISTSSYGKIRIRMRPDISPTIVQMVMQLANRDGNCSTCNLYRHEPAPKAFGRKQFFGPPYALLQGSLADLPVQPPFEGNPVIQKGDVCIIPQTKEFFIATADHPEWGTSHTIWGQVADAASWAVIDSIPYEPYTTRTSGGYTTRWLTPNATVPFSLSMETQPELPQAT